MKYKNNIEYQLCRYRNKCMRYFEHLEFVNDNFGIDEWRRQLHSSNYEDRPYNLENELKALAEYIIIKLEKLKIKTDFQLQ